MFKVDYIFLLWIRFWSVNQQRLPFIQLYSLTATILKKQTNLIRLTNVVYEQRAAEEVDYLPSVSYYFPIPPSLLWLNSLKKRSTESQDGRELIPFTSKYIL